MRIRHGVFSFALMVLLGAVAPFAGATEAIPDNRDPVIDGLRRGDDAAACRAAAEAQGRSPAMDYFLGTCLESGVGMARDRDTAARAYRSAMDGGERNAGARLGMLIATGAVSGQVTDGARLVREAAEFGNAEGAFLWSELLRAGGTAVARDDLEAIRWLRRAADGGSAQAATVLAALYESGTLVPQDASLARQWRERAATMRPGAWKAGPVPVPESQDVRNWQRQMDLAAERGDNAEYFRLAQLLAQHGKAGAQAVVASFHESGTMVPRDYAQAERWYRKAVAGGSDMGRIRLALMIGRKQASGTSQEAFDLIRPSALSGRPEAEYLKGMMLIQGLGVAADPVEAVYWLRRAALKGHADGALMVAAAYHDGKGVPKDMNLSRTWMETAGKAGSVQARSAYCQSVGNGDFPGDAEFLRQWCPKAAP